MKRTSIAYFFLALTLCSCAMSYRPIRPAEIQHKFVNESEGLSYSYQFSVLSSSGNRKSANKEAKWPYKLVALKIENKSSKPIKLGSDVQVLISDKEVQLMEPEAVRQELGQVPGLYMIWSILWLAYSSCENNNCTTIPIPLGVVIGLINLGVASKAGKDFVAELKANDIRGVEIAPGQTVSGLVGIYVKDVGPLTLKLK